MSVFEDDEYQADWVTRKRTIIVDMKGNFMKTQNVDVLIGKMIGKYGELETTIRLARITNMGIDMLLEFNYADEIDKNRFEQLGFISSNIYKPLALLVELGFLIYRGEGGQVDPYRWRLNMNVI